MKHKFNTPRKKTQPSKALFSLERTRLPADTRNIKLKLIENFTLKLYKAVQFDREGKPQFFHENKKTHEKIDILAEPGLIKTLKDTAKNYANQYKKWIEKMADRKFSLSLSWRLIVGLGNPSVYETSMTLHHIYGTPYLPGSAIKGVARSYRILKIAEDLNQPEDYYKRVAFLETFLEKYDLVKKFPQWSEVKNIKINSPEDKNKKIPFPQTLYEALREDKIKEKLQIFQRIFGTQERQGHIIFFDAFAEDFEINYDIMNPHYGPYYTSHTKQEPPADYYNPTPIPFLVLENAQFTFYLGAKTAITADIRTDELETAKNWLKEALTEYGIGAKTALGYGMFNSKNKD